MQKCAEQSAFSDGYAFKGLGYRTCQMSTVGINIWFMETEKIMNSSDSILHMHHILTLAVSLLNHS